MGWIGGMAHPEDHIMFSKGLLRQGLSCACSFIPIFHHLDLQAPFPDILTALVIRGRWENGIWGGILLRPCWPHSFCFCGVLPSLWTWALHRGWKQERCREGGNSLSLVIPLCPGVIRSDLFSLIFFRPFCCYFSFFLSVSIFSPSLSLPLGFTRNLRLGNIQDAKGC